MEDFIKIEAQKYEVFNNDSSLTFAQHQLGDSFEILDDLNGRRIKSFLDGNTQKNALFVSKNPKASFFQFAKNFKLIHAAGGFVKNPKGELLVIKRNGKFDLPKGKVEKGEALPEAAKREVEEECGVVLQMPKELVHVSYHVYALNNNKWALKPTYWFTFPEIDNNELIPQKEEGISDVFWADKADKTRIVENTFSSLRPIFSRFLVEQDLV